MKPRTQIQQEVARLSKRLPRLTATQKAYAFRHCFKHYAIKRADGTNICTECGHSWKSEHDLADTVCGCTCPDCGMELEALRTRKRVFNENEYFCIITTCKQYQVIRFFFVNPDTRQGRQPSIPFMKWCRGGFRPMERQRPLPDCVECQCCIMTNGLNTATWRYARTTGFTHTI